MEYKSFQDILVENFQLTLYLFFSVPVGHESQYSIEHITGPSSQRVKPMPGLQL